MTDSRHPAHRRRTRRTLIGLVVFVVLFHLAGGWYFSGLIKTDGLEPRASEHNFGVRVVEVSNHSITLDGTDRRAIDHPGIIGLWWEDGYGQVGRIRSTDGTTVKRDLTIFYGDPPPLCTAGDLEQCPGVDLEGFAFPKDPSDVGLTFEEITFESPLGPMGAWLVSPPGEAGSIWAIHMHGWRTDRREAVRMLPAYAESGVTSLVIDYRNDPGAPADPSGLYRFGRTEWEDTEAAVQYALDNGADRVVLSGYSTGATAEMAFLAYSPLADRVVGVVFDSPNIDFGRVVSDQASRRTIPGTPIPLPLSLTATAKWIADLRFDVDWDAINYVDREDILQVPALVFHGMNDQRVPVAVSEDLKAAYPHLVTLISDPEADHVQTWNVDPARYEAHIGEFLAALAEAG